MNSYTFASGKGFPDPALQLVDHVAAGEVGAWKTASDSSSSFLLPNSAELAVWIAAPLEQGSVDR